MAFDERRYQREWKRARAVTHPEGVEARRERERERYRTDAEYRARRREVAKKDSMRVGHAADRAKARQDASIARASRNNAHYTPQEDAVVLRTDLTRMEIALRLGRTMHSVDYRRTRLRQADPTKRSAR